MTEPLANQRHLFEIPDGVAFFNCANVAPQLLYVAERHRDGRPLEENWILRAGSDDFARLTDYRDEYQAGSRRFDVGERTSFTLVPMAIAALEQLLEWQVDRIAGALASHTGRIEREAAARGLASLPAGERGPHMLGIRVPGSTSTLVPALAARGVYVGVRAGLVRVAPHLYTTGADMTCCSTPWPGSGTATPGAEQAGAGRIADRARKLFGDRAADPRRR